MKYKSFREMPVWQSSHKISICIFHLTVNLPKSEDYGLASQIRRSANSVSANISEAFGRKTSKDKSNFYIMARGSCFETQNHLLYGCEVGYFDKIMVENLLNEYDGLIFEINKIVLTLSKL